ncbi:MAG: hypothetical protein IKO72_01075 [Kiritimatiellae bacterium]|nr:hypothetical protein [Kiritimatiellia bacterium]
MVFACVAQMGCVTQRETIPPETKAELIRLGRIITNENEAEETRYNSRILYCNLIRDVIQKYGKKSVDRQTVIDSFMVDGRKPKDLWIDGGRLHYEFESRNGTFPAVTIYFGGWTGSYVRDAYPVSGIP